MSRQVAVVIPCYNAARFVAKTLDSVLAQTVAADIVAVDDGSTDQTLSVLEHYADRITILRHEGGANRGVSASRNLGAASTSAPFLAFLDADDLWHAEKLAQEIQVFEEQPEVGVVVSGCRAIDAADHPVYDFQHSPPVSDDELAGALLLDCFIQTPGQALIRRSVLDVVGLFDQALTSVEDHDLWVRLAERTRFAFLANITVQYRKHSTSASVAGAKRMWENGFAVLAKAQQRRHYGPLIARRRAVLHFRLAECAWRERAPLRAAEHVLRAAYRDPRRGLRLILGALLSQVC